MRSTCTRCVLTRTRARAGGGGGREWKGGGVYSIQGYCRGTYLDSIQEYYRGTYLYSIQGYYRGTYLYSIQEYYRGTYLYSIQEYYIEGRISILFKNTIVSPEDGEFIRIQLKSFAYVGSVGVC